VSRASSTYERELKDLLQGDPEGLKRYSRSLAPTEREVLPKLEASPFLVIRAAGSLGFDLVALRRDFAFPIEVKASRSDSILFSAASGRAAEQLAAHRRAVDRVGLLVLYAYRRLGLRSGDPWRLYTPAGGNVRGRLEVIRKYAGPIDRTRTGQAVLRWDAGLPLGRFLGIVTFLGESLGG
jgi:hypothetical protein